MNMQNEKKKMSQGSVSAASSFRENMPDVMSGEFISIIFLLQASECQGASLHF
jgi:hypothetical protein